MEISQIRIDSIYSMIAMQEFELKKLKDHGFTWETAPEMRGYESYIRGLKAALKLMGLEKNG